MTLPNKLTIFRILLIPLMVVFYYYDPFGGKMLSSTPLQFVLLGSIFVIASLTDFFDGYLARKWNQVTTFGKFMDPLADKILVVSTMLLLLEAGLIPAWMIIIVTAREFMVSGVRLLAATDGVVIAASNLGKYKTASTMIALVVLLFFPSSMIGYYIMLLAVVLTIWSGWDYLKKNISLVLKSK